MLYVGTSLLDADAALYHRMIDVQYFDIVALDVQYFDCSIAVIMLLLRCIPKIWWILAPLLL